MAVLIAQVELYVETAILTSQKQEACAFSSHVTQVALHALSLPRNAVLATVENIWIKLQRPAEQLALLGFFLTAQTEYVLNAALDVSLVHQGHFARYVMEQQGIN